MHPEDCVISLTDLEPCVPEAHCLLALPYPRCEGESPCIVSPTLGLETLLDLSLEALLPWRAWGWCARACDQICGSCQ